MQFRLESAKLFKTESIEA